MNPRQFVNSAICVGIDKARLFRKYGDALLGLFFPDFLKLPPSKIIGLRNPWKFSGAVFLYVFFFLFVVQACWSYLNGRFFSSTIPLTKNFLDDWENVFNYTVICELYCIFGLLSIKNIYLLGHDIRESSLTRYLGLNLYSTSNTKGFLGAIAVLLIPLVGAAGYATELHTYKSFYWFMESGPPGKVSLGPLGYYYVFVNFLLQLLVVWVAFSHLGFLRFCGTISARLRDIAEDEERRAEWLDEHKIKKWLYPISKQILVTKLFVAVIAFNLVLWKVNEPNVGLMLKISVSALLVYGIWIVSVPRYYIQYRIFEIWKRHDMHEYKDLSMPWLLGASATVDLVLISFLVRTLAGDDFSKLMSLIS